MACSITKDLKTIPNKLTIQTPERIVKYILIKRSLLKNIRTIK